MGQGGFEPETAQNFGVGFQGSNSGSRKKSFDFYLFIIKNILGKFLDDFVEYLGLFHMNKMACILH